MHLYSHPTGEDLTAHPTGEDNPFEMMVEGNNYFGKNCSLHGLLFLFPLPTKGSSFNIRLKAGGKNHSMIFFYEGVLSFLQTYNRTMFFNQKGKINSFINLKLNRSPLFNNSTTKKVYLSSALPPLDFIHKLSSLVLLTRAFILQKRPLVNITLFAISFIKYS